MFTPPHRQCARAIRPAGAASVASAAVWRRYPKRDGKGRIEWIHWADLDLAAAWAEQALRDLDAFVVKYSGPTASAAALEGAARAPITAEAFGVLRSLNSAFQALNVPPIVAPTSDEFGAVDLIRSFVVLTSGRVQVRTQLMLSASRRGPTPAEEMAAFWRTLGARELANDEGVVVDIRGKRAAFRGAFEAALAFKRNAANGDRAFLALWARRPWTLVRAEDETELVWSAPLVWERDRVVRKLELARPVMQMIARDPWSALVSARERVKENNDALAIEWAGRMPELATTSTALEIRRVQDSMTAVAQARSEAALAQARAAAREGLATGAGSVAGVLGALSAAAPPAALVLAPAAGVLSAIAALAGLLLQVIPREWLAMAEVVPPRLPLPNMISGDEGPSDFPSHSVTEPGKSPSREQSAATSLSLEVPSDHPAQSITATVATSRASTTLARTPHEPSPEIRALLLSNGVTAPRVEVDREGPTQELAVGHQSEPNSLSTPSLRSNGRNVAIAAVVIGASTTLWWWLSEER